MLVYQRVLILPNGQKRVGTISGEKHVDFGSHDWLKLVEAEGKNLQ